MRAEFCGALYPPLGFERRAAKFQQAWARAGTYPLAQSPATILNPHFANRSLDVTRLFSNTTSSSHKQLAHVLQIPSCSQPCDCNGRSRDALIVEHILQYLGISWHLWASRSSTNEEAGRATHSCASALRCEAIRGAQRRSWARPPMGMERPKVKTAGTSPTKAPTSSKTHAKAQADFEKLPGSRRCPRHKPWAKGPVPSAWVPVCSGLCWASDTACRPGSAQGSSSKASASRRHLGQRDAL